VLLLPQSSAQGWTIATAFCSVQPSETSTATANTGCLGACCPIDSTTDSTVLRQQLQLASHQTSNCLRAGTVTFQATKLGQPTYLSDLLRDFQRCRTLRSSRARFLRQRSASSSFASRAFAVAALTVWNNVG